MATQFTTDDVTKIAVLANIPVTDDEKKELAAGFTTTIAVVDKLSSIDVSDIAPVSQITGLENILREDAVDVERSFTQEEALANAPRVHNGYFVVNQVIGQEE